MPSLQEVRATFSPKAGSAFEHVALAGRRPELLDRLAFITGDTLGADLQSFLAESGAPRLETPFSPSEVRNPVRQLVRTPHTGDHGSRPVSDAAS